MPIFSKAKYSLKTHCDKTYNLLDVFKIGSLLEFSALKLFTTI